MSIQSSRWSDSQKAALVQQIVSGSVSLERACADYQLSVDEIKDWVCVFRRSVRQALDRQLRSTLSLQGLEVEELNRPEFSGELADMKVADLVQTIQLGRKDAKITISHGGGHSYVWCEGGEIVDAECGTLTGEPALYRILGLDQGSVVADFFSTAARTRRIATATQQLLLEGATRRDRCARALRRIGESSSVFSVVSSIAARHARHLGPEELAVLSLFDGSRSLARVLSATELPECDLLEIAAGFREQGILRLSLEQAVETKAVASRQGSRGFWRGPLTYLARMTSDDTAIMQRWSNCFRSRPSFHRCPRYRCPGERSPSCIRRAAARRRRRLSRSSSWTLASATRVPSKIAPRSTPRRIGVRRVRSRERVINVGFGLGAPVVDGTATPDMLRLDEKGRVVEALVADKTAALVVQEGALARIPTSGNKPALNDARIRDLADIALRLEKIQDVAYDVEFACDESKTWLVQVRPATGRGFPEGGDATTVWSSVNVGEALPGVATPMTWSVAGAFSEEGFRKAFATLGCRVPKSARLVGNVHGRFYLNLSEFMRIAAQVPWLDPRTLVELGGGSGADEVAAQVLDVSHKGFYARLPMTASRLLQQQLRLDEDVRKFEEWAERTLRLHHALDLAILPDEGLARTVIDSQAMLERTGTVMLTCASSSLGAHVALKTLLSRVSPIDADRLAQALTAGVRDLESARPAIGLMRVAALAIAEPEARAAIERETTTGLDAIPDGPTRRALVSFLELYGDRAVREPELSTPRWKEDPRPVLTMLRVALRGEARDTHMALENARTQADAEMTRVLDRMNVFEQTALRHLVARAQKAARMRERMRGWVTRVLGLIREVLLDGERRLLRLMPDIQDDERAMAGSGAPSVPSVFLLTVDELVAALRNARTDLAPLLRLRRAEYARDVLRPDPPVTFVGAPVDVQPPPASGDVLRGIPASSGVVQARVRVLRSADMSAFQPGEILVVRTTDVGWTPLFLMAAGVVTELGGALSHAAIVAREFGVPSVVNVASVTRLLRTGDMVRVDGDQGTIERIHE